MEAWYGGMAFCWMLLIGAFLLHRRSQVEQWKRQLADRTLNSVPEVIWSVGPDGQVDFVSEQWAEHYGGTPKSLLGKGWLMVVHPHDRRRALEQWFEAQRNGAPYECQYRIRLPDGSYRWAVARARPDFDREGQIIRWFGTCTDAHERVLAVEALKDSERLYRGILDASIDCIAVLSADGMVELVNGPGVAITELEHASDIEGHPFTRLWQRKSEATVAAAITKAAAGEVARFRSFCPTAKGTPKWWDVVLTPMPDDNGKVKGILAISRDITGDREKAEQLRWASEHDALTSLPNRRAFQSRLQAATVRAMETGGQIGLLLVDLDHFKHINDSLGHAAGDEVLKAVADRLRESVRDSDFVARVGGDEFAIILEHVRAEDDMLAVGEKVFARIQTPLRVGRRVLSAGASIGGAIFPKDAQTANDLFKTADTALYALKGSGRGGTMMFHGYMLEEVEKAARQLGIARAMINARSVVPVYQPKFDIHTNQIAGFEALLRWRDKRNGLQLPATVVEAFKDYELAAKIGELMQNSVAVDIRSWMQRGLGFGRVSINASPAEFLRDDYAERLLAVLAKNEVPPSLVEVEVTEHALLEHGPEYVARALSKLKQAGMFVSLDDFGTGYSSLSHLRDFPVDLVKIDQSFVQQMNEDPEIAAIVAAVLNLARSIHIDVVAEGVETPAQLELLRSMGCRLAQGHLFGKAVEQGAVMEMLGDRRAAAA
jgi:diguanylate cyclase (GGDEF)-like protein/PAS domain S-box-containing protein